MFTLQSLAVLLVLFSTSSFAQSSPASANIEKALVHQKLARQYVNEKKWALARDEARLSTNAAPKDEMNRDAWLLLAATEERLSNFSAARDAYEKYLALSPPPEKKLAVTTRFNEIKVKADYYSSYKWGSTSFGIIIGSSPTFKSKMQEELDSEMTKAMDFGIRFGNMSIGYKRGSGKSGAFKAPTTTTSSSGYSIVAAGSKHVVEEIYFQYNIVLTDQPETKGIVWSIPLYMAGVSNGTRTSGADSKLYSNFGYDLATGLSVDLYTKSTFSFDISALYHLGIPFGDVKNNNDALPIKDLNDKEISGSTSGAEVRIGIKFLFGSSPPEL